MFFSPCDLPGSDLLSGDAKEKIDKSLPVLTLLFRGRSLAIESQELSVTIRKTVAMEFVEPLYLASETGRGRGGR